MPLRWVFSANGPGGIRTRVKGFLPTFSFLKKKVDQKKRKNSLVKVPFFGDETPFFGKERGSSEVP